MCHLYLQTAMAEIEKNPLREIGENIFGLVYH